MYNRLKSLFRQSIVYGMGNALNQFVGVILVPVYTYFLTPEDYGVAQLLIVTSIFIGIVTQLGLATAIIKSTLYDQAKDTKTIYSTAFYILIASSLLIFGIGSALAQPVSILLFETPAYKRLVWLIFTSVALDTIVVIPLARLRIERRAWHYSILNFGRFGCRLLLNILFVAVWRRGAAGLIEANALQSLLFVFVYVWLIKDQLRPHFSKREFINLISFGLPLVPALISSQILLLSDRYILNKYAGLTEVGLYSLGYRIASVISLAVSAFQTAWPAVLFSAAKSTDAKHFYSRIMTYCVFCSGYLALGLSVLAEDTLKLISAPAFHSAHTVVPLLSLSYVFYGAYFVSITGIQLEKKTHYLAYIASAAAGFQISLNFVLIPRIGVMGAALNTAISYLAMPVMAILISHRFYHVGYEYKRLSVMAVVAAALYVLSRLIQIDTPLLSFGIRGLLAASFPLVLGVLNFYTDEEKGRLRYLLQRGWSPAGT